MKMDKHQDQIPADRDIKVRRRLEMAALPDPHVFITGSAASLDAGFRWHVYCKIIHPMIKKTGTRRESFKRTRLILKLINRLNGEE